MFALPHPELLALVRRNAPAGQPVYLVGGCVRDGLLGLPVHDLDFCLAQDALELGRRVADSLGAAFYPLDRDRGIARVLIQQPEGRLALDFADFQAESLEADLRGRDFTFNAIAINLAQPESLIDPLDGANDLVQKILRTCSPASLAEDPVRILRGVRLAVSLELRMPAETRLQMRQALATLSRVSPERLRDELFRILENPQPVVALRMLDILGALPAILPELADLKGVTQAPPHIYDVWEHTLEVTSSLPVLWNILAPRHNPETSASWMAGMVSLRLGRYRAQLSEHLGASFVPDRSRRGLLLLAALYHDSGKPQTRQEEATGRIRFFEHEQASAVLARQRGQALRLSIPEIDYLESVVRHHLRPLLLAQTGAPPTRRAIYRFFRSTNSAGVDICLHALADTLATYGPGLPQDSWADLLEVVRQLLEAWWENPAQVRPTPLLTGDDVIQAFSMSPGRQVGALLEALLEAQASGEIQNRQEALTFGRRWLDEANQAEAQ